MVKIKVTLSIDGDTVKILKKKAIDANMTLSDYLAKAAMSSTQVKAISIPKKGNIPF